MVVVLLVIIARRFMALGTDPVTGGAQAEFVWLMTVATNHAGAVHLALQERTVDIVFIEYLAIVVVQRPLGQGQSVRIQQIGAIVVVA
jgi:hypothetical protein